MFTILATLQTEAAVVGVVCLFFLGLMVFAGIRQILKEKSEDE